ncbi:MAG: DUF3320 domain-containing protein [Tannerellaceae bacterium]|jgi:superfamily I DNA and/or RNA helicase|nr:DUF3320 domain-containing protein [Tannerellaceae bacterium]
MVNKISVEFLYLPVINFAMQQNRVSAIRLLSVENLTDECLSDLRISLSVEPEFAATTPVAIEAIAAKETVRIENLKLSLSTRFFAQLTEKLSGAFTLEVYSGEERLFQEDYPVDILAFDQWSGLEVLPEMLSSFITPNHPMLSPLIKRAVAILEKWTGNSSLDEYQSRSPNRVRQQMAAVYTAMAEQEIVYSKSPASFENKGQRIRLADTVLSQKLGTCLDMALLYASCLEAIGLHPLIMLVQGHAFSGAWLVPETFPDSITDDISFLSKRTAEGINEISLVECTCMNKANEADFDTAVGLADKRLLSAADFLLALDVKRSRFAGIRPLPLRILNGDQWEIQAEESQLVEKSAQTPARVNPYDLSSISPEIQLTKQLLWERKLLDLSLRNNLLNIRITKNTLQLISVDLHKFGDALADGDEFRILPIPSDWNNPLYDFGLYQSLGAADPVVDLVRLELSQKRLRSYLSEMELDRALLHLYRSSRLSIEENGANTLYLALGLLKWYETPNSERPRYAPILLLPVEIIRKSAAKGYVIRSREEEAMMNITLLEMLRQNFGISIAGLDPLPTEEGGVDVKLIYAIIRNSIKNQPKWDVEELVILGIFSFNKFIMWNDIHNNTEKLKRNKIVSSLINGKIEWTTDEAMSDAAVLDRELRPTELMLPINADSSQLESIYEAINDKSYILHGPPGTGKSQTITNIIANALYKGKRVLFVAEKMAALSVVQNRLSAIGLAPFCLELHSNKAKKTSILAQLKASTEVIKKTSPENFAQEADRLHQLRNELNTYIDALHKKYPFGLSAYDAIARYLSIEQALEFTIPPSLLDDLRADRLVEWQDAIEKLSSVGKACGHPYNHPLTGISIEHYSAEIKDKAAVTISQTLAVLLKIKGKIDLAVSLLGDQGILSDPSKIPTLTQIMDLLLHIPDLSPAWIAHPRLNELFDEYRETVKHGKAREALREQLLQSFTPDMLSLEARSLLASWNQYATQWFVPKYFGQKKIKTLLNLYTLQKKVESKEVGIQLLRLIQFQEEDKQLSLYADQLPLFFGKSGKNKQEDWALIEQILDESECLNNLMLQYTNDIVKSTQAKESLAKQLSQGMTAFRKLHGKALSELQALFSELALLEEQLSASLSFTTAMIAEDAPCWIDAFCSLLNTWLENLDKLKDWYQWLLISNKLNQLQLGFIAEAYKERNLPTEALSDIFNKSFYRACISYILSKESDLELFKGDLFNDVIEKYKLLTANFTELTKKELYARLASNIPSFTQEATQNSEVGILQKNVRNNGRGLSIRRLFDQIPTLLSRMCPCMLMSPISVAQYIDPDTDKFDLIVFDEASQMPTYEAVGAIARGKNIVIVGDPKQMPPTNFFSVNTVDEDNIEMEDLESILDDCLALSMPSKYLLWHYRSKHESLIAFSNAEYYENKLLTFPSPDNIESKVGIVPVSGFYDKGKTRQNKAEAKAVVDEIAKRLADENLRKRSIGVVTFSSVQQTLIEDLLSELFIARPELETLALECEEPLFIKNLENVQGDERDIILFSVGYGPDLNGHVSMNFGPLNRLGGERRLNVAVSRARYEMRIFSTLKSEQIDLNRTSSVGVAGLKRFLEYAEKKTRLNSPTASNKRLSMEHLIAREIEKQGYTVHTSIGCSGYKVDLGIVDKSNPAKYILGIICDGENYRQTKTARDREIVQTSVLNLLGWNIQRIWTMDWWENKQAVLDSIMASIKHIEENKALPPPRIEESTEAEEAPEEAPEPKSDIKESNSRPYRQTQLAPVGYTAEAFFFLAHKNRILSQIQEVIDIEAPISRSLLCKRVLAAWDISRLGNRLDDHLKQLLRQAPAYQSRHDKMIFFWQSEEQYLQYAQYRPHSGRDVTDLPPEEIANAVRQILSEQISLPTTDLVKVCGQLFGFARTGSHVDAAMYRGIKEAIRRNYIKEESGRAIIV